MLKKFFPAVALLFLFVLSARSQNQAVDYLYNRTSEVYSPLENDTTLGTGFQDDVLYMSLTNFTPSNCISCTITGEGFPIGFPFVFDGNSFTRWAFSSNGFIKLGNGTFSITNSLSGAFTSDQENLIGALHADIMMTEIQGSFRYRTIGNPGSRILVVEYRNNKHYTPNVTSEEIYNFQIRLHEGSNRISYTFGTFLKDEVNRTYTLGIKGAGQNDFHLRTVPASAPSWNSNTRGTSLSSTMAMDLNLQPFNGTVYNFIPRQYDNDLALEEILEPLRGIKSCQMGIAEQVKVKIKNTGVLAQSSAVIGYKAGIAPVVLQNVSLTPALAANETRDFTFTVPANLTGFYPPELRCFVYIPNEEEGSRNNDTLSVAFTVGRPFETHLISSYDSLLLAGWKTGRGATTPGASTYSLWKGTNAFSVNSSALEMRIDTPLVKNEWLYSPGYRVDTAFNYAISFQAAITGGLTGTGPATSIGDDTVKFMYSTDCRNTWKVLKVFNESDLTSGAIGNTLKGFQVNLPSTVKELVTFAFMGKNNGNTFTSDYRFHFRNFILNRVPRFDVSADTVKVPSIVSLSCKYSNQEMLTIRITNHGFDALDSTEAGYSLNGNIPIRKKFGFSPALQPGASAILEFTGTSGADMSNSEGTVITAFTNLKSENVAQRNNDTIRKTYALIAPLSIPTPAYANYTAMLAARWQRGKGVSIPSGPISGWGNRTTFPAQATTGLDFGAAPSQIQDWFYSASYEGPSIVKFAFKAAVTALGSTGAAASMNQDKVKVLYSVDCGASWTTAREFAAADLTSGAINNTLKEFVFEFSNPRGAILVGFAGFRDQANPVTGAFTFHLDSVSLNSPSFSDLSATNMIVGANGVVTCPSTDAVQVGVMVKNSGSSLLTSATVGYKVNGTPFSKNVVFTPPLAVGGKDTVYFTGIEAPTFPNSGDYGLKGFVILPAEGPTTGYNDSTSLITFRLYATVPLPYVEHFDGTGLLPVGWVSDTVSGKGFKITAGRGPSGSSALSFRSQGNFAKADVVTRNFGLVSQQSKYLGLSYKTLEQSGAFFRLRPNDFINIWISIDCGVTYGFVGKIDSLNQEVAAGFLKRDFQLDAYLGQDITVKIEAKMTPKAFSSTYLDIAVFSIGGPTVSDLPLVNFREISAFPNPCTRSDGFYLNGAEGIDEVVAFGMNGQQVTLPFVMETNSRAKVSTQSLANGVYIFKIKDREGIATVKMVVSE